MTVFLKFDGRIFIDFGFPLVNPGHMLIKVSDLSPEILTFNLSHGLARLDFDHVT